MIYKYALATGHIVIVKKRSRDAVKLLSECDGFYGVHPTNEGTLFFYDTLNDAKTARNRGKAAGIGFGTYISKFRIAEDNVPEFVEVVE